MHLFKVQFLPIKTYLKKIINFSTEVQQWCVLISGNLNVGNTAVLESAFDVLLVQLQITELWFSILFSREA